MVIGRNVIFSLIVAIGNLLFVQQINEEIKPTNGS